MTEPTNEDRLRGYLHRATADLRQARRRLREAEDRQHEPIAVVGIGCRYPGGVRDPEELWQLVRAGRDAVGPFPEDRGWDLEALFSADPDQPGTATATEGGFLTGAGDFDAAFFDMSPREALATDPQQRLLLEVSWEAVEHAGIDPSGLAGSRTGVFAGVIAQHYPEHLDEAPAALEGHLMTGTTTSIASGRVAYALGLEGPAVTLDTACSSSLVALHLAAQALRRGECDLALAGGVTVLPTPHVFVGFSRQRGLAPDGRCKAFSAAADGAGFAEGIGVLLVERLSDAQRNEHPVLAVVRGSAVNSDGASNGLTAPNGPSQQRVIWQALADAGLEPADVDAVEAHGTGTALGDPIEAQALLSTYGRDRDPARPLRVGSIKSNLGHTQAAAGVAGVIKMIMALRHEELPRTLHVTEPTPHVDWSSGAVELLTEAVAWPDTGALRRAGVSSFGISGTNAHVLVEQAPAPELPAPPPAAPVVWPLSARSDEALRAQAAALRAHLAENPGLAPQAVGWTLASGRAALEHRAVLFGPDPRRALDALAAGEPDPGLVRGKARARRTAFLFAGQGSQRPGMGRDLSARFPVFAEHLEHVCAKLDRHLDRPLREILFAGADTPEAALLDQTRYTQCALFAFEVALYRLVDSFGVRADYLVGHSVGEVAAAHVAGVLSLDDGCTLVAARGALMQALPEGGAMAAIEAAEEELAADLAGLEHEVSLAAVNGPRSAVISGSADAVATIEARWRKDNGRRTRMLSVSHAFHSPLMDAVLEDFRAVVSTMEFGTPVVPVVSTVTGEVAGPDELRSAAYWVRHLRQAVRFHDGVRTVAETGVDAFVEIGPDRSLTAMAGETAGPDAVLLPLLSRTGPETETFVAGLARVHTTAARVDWTGPQGDTRPHQVALPTYAFQHERYWLATIRSPATDPLHDCVFAVEWETPPALPDAASGVLLLGEAGHPALRRLPHVSGDELAENRPQAMVFEVPAAGPDPVAACHDTTELALRTVRDWLRDERFAALPLIVATSDELGHAGVRGLLRSACAEHPGRIVSLGLSPDASTDTVLRAIAYAVESGEPEISAAEGVAVPRLIPAELSDGQRNPIDPDRTVLITGASGTLAGLLAEHLAGQGQRHLMLTTRGDAEEVRARLAQYETEVTIVACDLSDPGQVRALVDSVPAEYPLTAVVHTAGAVRDATVENLTAEDLHAVLAPKVDAAYNLHQATQHLALTHFVTFSSAAATLGNPGQANYTAANAYEDALAHHRRRHNQPATALAWGPWREPSALTATAAGTDRHGLVSPLHKALGLALFDAAVAGPHPHLVLTRLNTARLGSRTERPAVLRRLIDEPEAPGPAGIGAELAALDPSERRKRLAEHIAAAVATILGHPPEAAADPSTPFKDLGFDSLAAVELRNHLTGTTGLALPSTLVYDHPTVGTLAEYLAGELGEKPAAEDTPATPVRDTEPIAIIGMACRFPGDVESPEQLWRLVADGRDAVGAFPSDRGWDLGALYDPDPERPGTSYVREGAFLRAVDEFDAPFFGIGRREAMAADPQQRMLLEVSWEALERSGLDPQSLRGSGTGVYVGMNYNDYLSRLNGSVPEAEGYLGTGNSASVASGRISYQLGLRGPALTVDTACSSSLVALHLAAQALRRGECTLALAGGVTVMSTPSAFVEFSRQRGLAPDGRCKPFAATADGTGWGEGAGMLLLERLTDAHHNNHPVLATIRGSAINQDGASNGLTAPNGPAQQHVIRQALANAGLTPSDIDAVEAHGTGTTLGDPIEAGALHAVFAEERDQPLWIGSVKSNIGHTQAAAGVAGVIKAVEALRHEVLPRSLHVDAPTAHARWGAIRLLTEPVPWPRGGRPRRIGISSFGLSGTNAHVLVEEPARRGEPEPHGPDEVLPFLLSGRDDAALRAQAARLREFVADHPEHAPADIAAALGSRTAFRRRAAVVAGDRDELDDALASVSAGLPAPAAVLGTAGPAPSIAFLFTGQGSQRPGMGRELYERFPVYRETFDEIADAMAGHLDIDLPELVLGEGRADHPLNATRYAQPALFAVETALFRLVASFGLAPDHLLGHSVGELVAAHVSGSLPLEPACEVVAARGRLMQAARAGGAMVAVGAPVGRVREELADLGDAVSVAAVNGPSATVVSGDREAVLALAANWRERGVRTAALRVSHAFHSAHMDDALDRFREVLSGVEFGEPRIPIVSNLTGKLATAADLRSPDYWARHIRETVRFADGIGFLAAQGATVFLELGPDAALAPMARECLPPDAVVAPVLRADRSDTRALLAALAAAHTHGSTVDWLLPGTSSLHHELPTYPFQRQSYWLPARAESRDLSAVGLDTVTHPLIGASTELPDTGTEVRTGSLSAHAQPWAVDHAGSGARIVRDAVFVELALHAAESARGCEVAELSITDPLVLAPEETARLRLVLEPAGADDTRRFAVHARPGPGTSWLRCAEGLLAAPAPFPTDPLPDDEPDDEDISVSLPTGSAPATGAAIHPALLHATLTTAGRELHPAAVRGLAFRPTAASSLRVRTAERPDGTIALWAFEETGQLVLSVAALTFQPRPELPPLVRLPADSAFGVEWEPVTALPRPEGVLAVLGERPDHPALRDLPAFSGSADAVVLPVPLAEDPVSGAHHAAEHVLLAIQAWLSAESRAPLVVVTQGATTGVEPAGLAHSSSWGLVRSAQLEHPGRFVLVDLDPASTAGALRQAVAHALRTGEHQLALRGATAQAPRLVPVPLFPADDLALDPDHTVLITGAGGSLAGHLARHLATRGHRRFLLATSNSRPGAIQKLTGELSALGAHPTVAAADIADLAQVRALVDAVPDEHPLAGVIHTAGTTRDATADNLTAAELHAVLEPKVDGAHNLHQATQHLDLTHFVTFSSAAATLGNPGQANYAAANAWLDALAAHRRYLGRPAIALAWGPWQQETALTAKLGDSDRARIERSGVTALTTDQGLALFDAALASPHAHLVTAHLDLARLRRHPDPPPLLRGLAGAPSGTKPADDLASAVSGMAPEQGRRHLLDHVIGTTNTVLALPAAAATNPATPFKDLGFDSLAAIELRNHLTATTGLDLAASLVFDHPTPEALAAHLHERLVPEPAAPADQLLAELRRVEDRLAVAAEAGDATAAAITARLTAMLSAWQELARPAAPEPVRERLDAAGPEEIFAFIDQELGRDSR
ncbi:SDR family NAD(P)-dependent oxidoreductase [Amycolatopsis sp. NPDC004079]|uniref:SDR family NAD(P)-dependent oxidoreductase n=1 Tax=Amycolatopsis sp. NPDC004079 TaxID=3154549 RepID=UPI0033A2ACD0